LDGYESDHALTSDLLYKPFYKEHIGEKLEDLQVGVKAICSITFRPQATISWENSTKALPLPLLALHRRARIILSSHYVTNYSAAVLGITSAALGIVFALQPALFRAPDACSYIRPECMA
jgi:hypothetical protein